MESTETWLLDALRVKADHCTWAQLLYRYCAIPLLQCPHEPSIVAGENPNFYDVMTEVRRGFQCYRINKLEHKFVTSISARHLYFYVRACVTLKALAKETMRVNKSRGIIGQYSNFRGILHVSYHFMHCNRGECRFHLLVWSFVSVMGSFVNINHIVLLQILCSVPTNAVFPQ